MRCEELEAIVFSGREIAAEERAEMEAHAETCEACRALMDNADALRGMQRIDEDVTPPESFTRGWRMAIRQTPRVISISDWMRRATRLLPFDASHLEKIFDDQVALHHMDGTRF